MIYSSRRNLLDQRQTPDALRAKDAQNSSIVLLLPVLVVLLLPSVASAAWPDGWRNGPGGAFGPPIPLTEPRSGDSTIPEPLPPGAIELLADLLDLDPNTIAWRGGRRIDDLERHDLVAQYLGRMALGHPLRVVISREGKLVAVLGRPEQIFASPLLSSPSQWLPSEESMVELAADHIRQGQSVLSCRQGWWRVKDRHVATVELKLTGHLLSDHELLRISLDGDLIERESLVRHIDGECSLQGHMQANWSPDLVTTPIFPHPLPYLDVTIDGVGTFTTDTTGAICADIGGVSRQISGGLSGPFANVIDGRGPELTFSDTLVPGSPLEVVLNSTPTEDDTAEVAAFYHVNRAREFLTGLPISPPFTGIDFPLQVRVSRPAFGNCNAAYSSAVPEIFFLPAIGSSCVNTAYSTVVVHEYMHAVADAIFGTLTPSDLHEGIADCAAFLYSLDRDIGRGFFNQSTELRDVEPNLVHPVTVNPHLAGLVVAGSVWDLRTLFHHDIGSLEASRNLTAEIWWKSLFFLPSAIDEELVTTMLLADDDDANIANGTPNETRIRQAFSVHGLRLDPVPFESLLNFSDFRIGSDVTFSWSPGASYTEIQVERNGQPYVVLPGSSTIWTDASVAPGEYTYLFRPFVGPAEADPITYFLRQRRFLRGDLNHNGTTNIGDVVYILSYLFNGLNVADCLDAGDVNDSGTVNIADAIELLAYLFSNGSPPPEPTSTQSIDPTPDENPCGGEL